VLPKVITELEVDYSELPSNLISNLFNMHLGIEKIEKELSDLFGFLELMLDQGALEFHIQY
jgi:hypothetical protein